MDMLLIITQILLLILATERLTVYLTDYELAGPWDMFHWLRARMGVEYVGTVPHVPRTDSILNGLFRGVLCPTCVSVWIATILLPLFWLIPEVMMVLTAPLALSRLALAILKQT